MVERYMSYAAAKLAPEGYKVLFELEVDPSIISGYKASCNNRSISSTGADEIVSSLDTLDIHETLEH